MPSQPELHRGRLAKHPRVLSVRPLTREDLACLAAPRVGPPRIQQFRETHHRVARLVAAGLRNQEICQRTGYSPQSLGRFLLDPTFQQLVAEYKGKVDQAYIDSQDEFYETATSNMLRMERMVEEHLNRAEDTDDLIPLSRLGSLISDRADRFGYGKHSTQTNEIQNFAEMMKTIAAKSGRSNVIDATPASTPEGQRGFPACDTPQEIQFAPAGFRRRIQGRQG